VGAHYTRMHTILDMVVKGNWARLGLMIQL